jgi:hypothetical protein
LRRIRQQRLRQGVEELHLDKCLLRRRAQHRRPTNTASTATLVARRMYRG